jgi:hypothetical protein
VSFVVNGRPLARQGCPAAERVPVTVRLARRRKPAGGGYLARYADPLPEDLQGIAVSTFGKVIKRGWDWLGLAPAAAERIGGLIEVPGLAQSLTLNKADFIRAGARGAVYLAYRKAIQEAVTAQLSAWGEVVGPGERARRRAARPVERDLERVLADLADDFPLLGTLVEQRTGGQRRLPVVGTARPPGDVEAAALQSSAVAGEPARLPAPPPPEAEAIRTSGEAGPHPPGQGEDESPPAQPEAGLPRAGAVGRVATGSLARRPARYGLNIQFEARPDDPELGRLVESTVWVNEAHPAYRRASASRSEGYHVALAVAMALAPLAVEPAKEHAFITAFLARWGAALEHRRPGRRR